MFIDSANVVLNPNATEALRKILEIHFRPESLKCLVHFSRSLEVIDGKQTLVEENGYLIGEYNIAEIPKSARISISNFETAVYIGRNEKIGCITIDYSDGKFFPT